MATPRAKKKRASATDGEAGKTRAAGRRKAPAASRGLGPTELAGAEPPAEVRALARDIENDGGAVLSCYRDPLGGRWLLGAALPIERVEPTSFQRDLSDAHVRKLAHAIERLARYLDPIIVIRQGSAYHTPNGHHRLAAMRRLGARAITALVVPEPEAANHILALNTERAPGLRDRALEVVRLARALAPLGDPRESELADAFEEPALLTIGICYEKRARYSASVYHPVLRKVEAYRDEPLSKTLALREGRADRLLALDDEVARVVAALKARGLESPYLKAFVVARINPLRHPKANGELEDVLAKMTARARDFDLGRVDASQIGGAAGYGAPAED
jgi:ParB family chromosome partitioning protein